MHLTYTIREINILHKSAIEQPKHQHYFHGCHGSNYDVLYFERKILEIELPAILYFGNFIFILNSRYQAIMLLQTLNNDIFLIS